MTILYPSIILVVIVFVAIKYSDYVHDKRSEQDDYWRH